MKPFAFLLVISIFLASCGGKSTDKRAELEKLKNEQKALSSKIQSLEKELSSSDTTTEGHMKNVALTMANPQFFAHYIELQARIDAEENISISAKTPGVVSKIYVKTGDEVKEGQILAELDNAVMEQGIAELQNQLAFANNLYQKQKNLWDQKIGTEIQFLSAKNNKETLEKKLATTKEQSDMSKLKSPINGVVDAVDIRIGQAVAPGVPAVRVVNMSLLKVKGEVAESYASKVKKGDHVLIEFPDLKKEINGEISFAARVINPLTRTFNAEVKLENSSDFHPNMLAVMKIIDYKNDSALVVPQNVLQEGEDGKYIFTASLENGKKIARRMKVISGLTYNNRVEIVSGIKPGTAIITTGYQDLNDGEIVQY